MTLMFSAWSFGGYANGPLHFLLLGGLGTFLFSILPLPKSCNGHDQQHGNLKNIRRLFNKPFFWVSVCFLGYIVIQILNPSIVQVYGEKSWWVEPLVPPFGTNLPSSVKADYNSMNAVRTLVIHVSAFSLACGIMVGIQRRVPALITIWSFLVSGVAMSFVAILQKFSGTELILWCVESSNDYFWGTFMYRNQGAAFLMLVLLVSSALYFFYLKRANERLQNGGPHFLLFGFVFLLLGSIWLALSRAGIILSVSLAVVFCLIALAHHVKRIIEGRSFFYLAIFLSLFIVSTIFFVQFSDWEDINKRVEHLQEVSLDINSSKRMLSSKATWEMAQDRLRFGWGAGSFRYIFPIYQKEYRGIWYNYFTVDGWAGRRIYHYAHNDWVQFLAEYGISGTFLILCLFFCLLIKGYEIFKYSISSGLILVTGLILIFIHNLVDFIFSSPSYWVAFWGTLFLICKLCEIEKERKYL